MFGNKDEKRAAKEAAALARKEQAAKNLGLDFEGCTIEELRAKNLDSIKNVADLTAGSSLYTLGSLMSGNSDAAHAMIAARTQIDQNFILIRQNEEIIRLLGSLVGR